MVLGMLVLLGGFWGGCGLFSLDENSESVRDLIERNRENWEEEGIESYRLTYNRTVGRVEQDSVRVTVRGGEIDSVSVEGGGVDDPDAYLTVDRLYEEIVANFEREDRGGFQVQFNEEVSYPERYRMEAGEETIGRGVVVTNFSRLDAPVALQVERDLEAIPPIERVLFDIPKV